jgi:hypothetical protein
MKEGPGTPPAVAVTNTPASGAQTVKTKKVLICLPASQASKEKKLSTDTARSL